MRKKGVCKKILAFSLAAMLSVPNCSVLAAEAGEEAVVSVEASGEEVSEEEAEVPEVELVNELEASALDAPSEQSAINESDDSSVTEESEAVYANSNIVSGEYGNGGDSVTWSLNKTTGKLTISGTGNMKIFAYESLVTATPWSSYKDSIKDVVISDDITYISENAFRNLTLESLSMPGTAKLPYESFENCSVKKLIITGKGAMRGKSSYNTYRTMFYLIRNTVEELVIEDGVTSIGNYAFSDFGNLSKITIADSVTSIEKSAFMSVKCTGELALPKNLKSLGELAFASSTIVFGDLVIPDTVETIGKDAFNYCKNVTSVKFGSGLKSLGESSFLSSGVSGKVVIPDNVTSFGCSVFQGCKEITEIQIPAWATGSDALFTSPQIKKVTITGSGKIASYGTRNTKPWDRSSGCLEEVVISDGVTEIGENAFADCSNLKIVSIPDSVTRICNNAFYNCSNLKIDRLPTNLEYIGNKAFELCPSINCSLILPESITDVGEFAFAYSNISSVAIHGSVTKISKYAFYSCENLTSIVIVAPVEDIDYDAFGACKNVESVYLPHNISKIDNVAFKDCGNNTENKSAEISFEDGYTYKFYSDEACENEVEDYFTRIIEGDITYVKAEEIKTCYTIKFDGNGSTSGEMTDISDCLFNSKIELTENAFARTGCKFIGWADSKEKAEAGTVDYDDKENVLRLVEEDGGSITLYAVWEPIEYSISYKLNDDVDYPATLSEPKVTYTVVDETFELPSPSRDDYTFLGWYTDEEFKDKLEEVEEGSTGNISVYAKWIQHIMGNHVDAKTATCQAGGNVEYWECSFEGCNACIDNDGNVIEDVNTPIDEDNHVGSTDWQKTLEYHYQFYTCCDLQITDNEEHEYGTEGEARYTCSVCEYVDEDLKAAAEKADEEEAERKAAEEAAKKAEEEAAEKAAKELAEAKEAAKAAIDAEVGKDASEAVKKAAEEAKKNVDNASTVADVNTAKTAGIDAIKAVKEEEKKEEEKKEEEQKKEEEKKEEEKKEEEQKKEEEKKDDIPVPGIVGSCQIPNPYGGGALIGFEPSSNGEDEYYGVILLLDCTKLMNGDPNPWIYSTGKRNLTTGGVWTQLKIPYGYYWTLFRIYDKDGNLVDEQCYGFENI